VAILVETRGPKQGICNICGEYGSLTEDHTPPKGCIKVKPVELHHIIEHLNVKLPKSKGRQSQNGVKYRTLCKRCNNSLLGTEYDPTFINFVNDLARFLKTQIHIPASVSIKTKPQRLMRALLGHVSAQGVNGYEKGKITESLRDYFLNPNLSLPASLNIYFWTFPYQMHVMARDCVLGDFSTGEHVCVWFLKFFPIAFMVTIEEPYKYKHSGLGCFSHYRSLGIDDEIDVTVNLKEIIPHNWPEAPSSKTSMVMYGQEAITSFALRKRKG
jgi:hypothetical protein